MYYGALDHAREDYPELLEKWKARGNQHQILNQNFQKILVEIQDE
jgi:hypothetical protein